MIDQKQLQDMEERMRIERWPFNSYEEVSELVRLAKLGLWARDHGIEACKKFDEGFIKKYSPGENWFPIALVISEALAALPDAPAKEG